MIGLGCVSIMNAVFMLKLFHYGRHNNPVPRWIQIMVLTVLANAICYTKIAYEDEILGSKTSLIDGKSGKKEAGEDGEKTGMNDIGASLTLEERRDLQETEKSHRVIDWQNVALIWDKFMFITTIIVTFGGLAIVFFLYVAEVLQNDIDLEEEGGIILDPPLDP